MNLATVAKVILVNRDLEKLLLIKRSSSDSRRPGQWDIPGGMVEEGEGLEAAACRECLEEVGIKLSLGELKLIYTERHFFDDSEDKLVNWLVFTATTNNVEATLSFEHDEYKWVDLKEAYELLTYDRYKTMMGFIAHHHVISGVD